MFLCLRAFELRQICGVILNLVRPVSPGPSCGSYYVLYIRESCLDHKIYELGACFSSCALCLALLTFL